MLREAEISAKYQGLEGAPVTNFTKRELERRCSNVIDKCRTLKDLHPLAKSCLIGKMKFLTLRKG